MLENFQWKAFAYIKIDRSELFVSKFLIAIKSFHVKQKNIKPVQNYRFLCTLCLSRWEIKPSVVKKIEPLENNNSYN